MDTIEKILNLMNLKGLDEASQASLSKNRHMFEIISYCDETNEYSIYVYENFSSYTGTISVPLSKRQQCRPDERISFNLYF